MQLFAFKWELFGHNVVVKTATVRPKKALISRPNSGKEAGVGRKDFCRLPRLIVSLFCIPIVKQKTTNADQKPSNVSEYQILFLHPFSTIPNLCKLIICLKFYTYIMRGRVCVASISRAQIQITKDQVHTSTIFVNIPWSIVNEGQFTEIISFFQGSDDTFPMDNNINGTFQQYVPRTSFISLIKYCMGACVKMAGNKKKEKKNKD